MDKTKYKEDPRKRTAALQNLRDLQELWPLSEEKKIPYLFAVTFSSLQRCLLQSHSQSCVTLVQQNYVSLFSVPLDKGNADSGNKIGSAQEKSK